MVAADWSGDDGSLLLFTKSNAFSGHFSTYIYTIYPKAKIMHQKNLPPIVSSMAGREVLTFLIHTGYFGFEVPALANLLVVGGRISQYIPPFGGYHIT